jgi:hypothetical protein
MGARDGGRPGWWSCGFWDAGRAHACTPGRPDARTPRPMTPGHPGAEPSRDRSIRAPGRQGMVHGTRGHHPGAGVWGRHSDIASRRQSVRTHARPVRGPRARGVSGRLSPGPSTPHLCIHPYAPRPSLTCPILLMVLGLGWCGASGLGRRKGRRDGLALGPAWNRV